MQPMLRRLFNAATFLSAFLLLTTLILWPLSHYRYMEGSYMRRTGTTFGITIASGRLNLTYQEDLGPYRSRSLAFATDILTIHRDWSYRTWNTSLANGVWFEGLGIFLNHFPGPLRVEEFLIPFSYLSLLFAALPIFAWRRHRRPRPRVGAFEVETAKS